MHLLRNCYFDHTNFNLLRSCYFTIQIFILLIKIDFNIEHLAQGSAFMLKLTYLHIGIEKEKNTWNATSNRVTFKVIFNWKDINKLTGQVYAT